MHLFVANRLSLDEHLTEATADVLEYVGRHMPSRAAVVSPSGVTTRQFGQPAEMALVTAVTAVATAVTTGLKPA
ncbi:hypothetical protein [Amycolatopsis sp. NPDC049159]|uniref:hypothetical protein n=1 Tax=Amycolatopsis sp. NPDC049159 TaxID=3157210 RepID=UPI0033EFFB52